MIDNGLIDEVKNLLDMGYTRIWYPCRADGYKELLLYLEGEYSLNDAIDILKGY